MRIANDTRFGLNGGIETADAAKGYEMALQIRAGSVALNGGTGRMTYAPIGGDKRSGIGREYGPDWLREYPQENSIFYTVGRSRSHAHTRARGPGTGQPNIAPAGTSAG